MKAWCNATTMRIFFNLTCWGVCSILFLSPTSQAVSANPQTFHVTQPDGKTITPQLYIRGDEKFSYITDRKGFTVIRDEDQWHVYARVEQEITAQGVQNCLTSSGLRVGLVDPLNKAFGLQEKALPDARDSAATLFTSVNKRNYCASSLGNFSYQSATATQNTTLFHVQSANHQKGNDIRRRLETPRINAKLAKGTLKNFVVLIRFADHINRTLPTPSDYDIIMNQRNGDAILAPTGSVRDVHLENSHDQLTIESVIYKDWITLSNTESYYADLNYGTNAKFNEAIKEAMSIIDGDSSLSLNQFDKDDDGILDVITFFHSGYGAENSGKDCHSSADASMRLWSHFRDKGITWCSSNSRNSKLCLSKTIVATGLWGTCSSSICRIGTVAHELGHFLGLRDMYDGSSGGVGVGCYSIMGSVWGFDFSQRHPPPLDPWSKIQLGWISPVVLNISGYYTLEASFIKGRTYKVQEGYPNGEYLLIENRQPYGFDTDLPQGGLAIWHIDELASYESQGFPGQAGWPNNGQHYLVALLQADGEYDLERGKNNGDGGDLWHSESKLKKLGPSSAVGKGPFPNTDSYQGGVVRQTGIEIRDIGESGNIMSFTLVLPGSQLPSEKGGTHTTEAVVSHKTAGTQAATSASITLSKSKLSIPSPVPPPPQKWSKKPVTIPPEDSKNASAASKVGHFNNQIHPLTHDKSNEMDILPSAQSVYVSLSDFNVTFLFLEYRRHDFETILELTEQYLDIVLTGYLLAQNISYLGLDLQIYDWSSSMSSPNQFFNNSFLYDQQFLPGASISTEVMFYGELELREKSGCLQMNAVSDILLLSLNGERDWNGTKSFISFLRASNETDVLDVQNVTATPASNPTKRGGELISVLNFDLKQSQRRSNMASVAMMTTIILFMLVAGIIFTVRTLELKNQSEIFNSSILGPQANHAPLDDNVPDEGAITKISLCNSIDVSWLCCSTQFSP